MAKKTQHSFDIRFPVAFGSGLATALLFVAARRQGAFEALLLASMSPLPIMIATLGFDDKAGLGAAIVAAVTIAALIVTAATAAFSFKVLIGACVAGLVFAACLSLPSWWFARLAGAGKAQIIAPWIARLVQRAGVKPADPETRIATRSRYPFGDILISIAVVAFVIVTAITVALVLQQPSFDAGLAKAVARVEPLITDMLGSRELPKSIELAALARMVVESMPATAGSMIVLAFAVDLWVAARVADLSHRLPYAWPDIPHDLRVPRRAAIVLIAFLGLSFLPGLAGIIASIGAAAVGLIFVLQGLAVVHDLSRGIKFRTALLAGIYVALALLMPWPLIIFALIGLAEAGFCLRDKKAAAASPYS
jgi:hypothetical protein